MKEVRAFLAQLNKELQRSEDFDIEARQILDDIHKDVDQLEESGQPKIDAILDRVNSLEAKFASKHPNFDRAIRELSDALAKMGI